MNHGSTTKHCSLVLLGLVMSVGTSGCDRKDRPHKENDGHDPGSDSAELASAPTNRVDIPVSVRQNLGVTFAKIESRNVAQTLRVPGQFELLPTARREYRTPLAGRVELLVTQLESVEAGTPLYRVDSAEWREVHEQIAATQARVDSMGPLRAALADRLNSLRETITLWQERVTQLDELRTAGGGSASQVTEARATLNSAQTELTVVSEDVAQLQAQQLQSEAELRSLVARHDLMTRAAACEDGHDDLDPGTEYTVCAVAPGVVEFLGVTPGGLAEVNGHVLTVVQPDHLWFRAQGMQSDLGRLKKGLPARIVPPQGASIADENAMDGPLQIGLTADADERTVDLVVKPNSLSEWARAGVSAQLEITLAGGSAELAIPLSAVVRDGATPIIFRRDPANPDKAIRMEADLGLSDGRWIVIASGVKEGDEVVVGGNYQLMLATSGSASKAGHFHSDGTFHEGGH